MALINRYQGNSGRVTRYNEPGERQSAQQPQRQRAQPERRSTPNGGAMAGRPMPPQRQTQSALGGLNDLGKLLPERIGELEVEDLILLLILYLMYRESGDSDLLIIMGAMFLL